MLVFTRTKHGADKLAKILNRAGIQSSAIHGNKSQNARVKAMNDFKGGACRVLIATDIAARGIDIDQLPLVINYDLPEVAETYVHRIGRTGRAGCEGAAWSFCSEDEFDYLKDIQKLTGLTIPVEGPVPEFAARQNAAPAQKQARKAAPKPAQKPARNALPAPRSRNRRRKPRKRPPGRRVRAAAGARAPHREPRSSRRPNPPPTRPASRNGSRTAMPRKATGTPNSPPQTNPPRNPLRTPRRAPRNRRRPAAADAAPQAVRNRRRPRQQSPPQSPPRGRAGGKCGKNRVFA